MAQMHDVLIDGAGYMLVPGGYTYRQSGAEIEKVRAGVSSFATDPAPGSDGRTVLDRDAVRWAAAGMMPLPSGLGLRPGPLVLAPREQQVSVAGTLGAAVWDMSARGIVYNGT